MRDFAALPKKAKKTDLDEYAVINVSPSLVPNPYLPAFRVFTYNVSGTALAGNGDAAEGEDGLENQKKKKKKKKGSKRKHGHHRPDKDRPAVDCKKKENKGRWECRPKKPQHADAESPSRSNQLWSPLGYAQVSSIEFD